MSRYRRPDFAAIETAEFQAERSQRAQPKVIGGAAARSEENSGGAQLRRGANELAGALSRGLPWIMLLRWQQVEATGGGHFDDGDRLPGF